MRGSAASSDAPLVPARVGRYEVLLPIASGGMATVYLARARGPAGFEREVALKVTHAHLREDEAFAADLIEEAKLAGRIRHPNVVPVIDVGDDPVGVYLVMDYVEGETLSGLLRLGAKSGEPLPTPVALRVLVDALEGLHAAHELTDENGNLVGLVHRDFSPQNILVGLDGCPRLADFGVAKAATRLGHTKTGLVKGKIHYMSPEQVRSHGVDRRCDVWAAGIIAWELVARRRLYGEMNDTATILQIVTQPPPRVSSVVPDVPPALDDAIAHALAMSVEDRCSSAMALARELSAAATGPYALATRADVARHVKRLVGPALARRRERVAELLELRAQMGELAATEVADQPTPSSTSVLGMRSSLEPGARNPSGPQAESTEHATSLAVAPTTPTWRPSERRSRASSVSAIAAAVAVVAFGVWLWRSRAPAPVVEPAAAIEASAPSVPSSAAAAEVLASAQAAPAPGLASPTVLRITANAPVAALQIGERVIGVPSPTAAMTLDLLGEEPTRDLQVVARSADGRRYVSTLAAGARTLEITFPVAAPTPQRPAGATKPAETSRGASRPAPAPLAPSPYEPKK